MRLPILLSLVPLALAAHLLTRAEADETRAPRTPQRPREVALVDLGRRLFFDPVVSRSGRRACASCHDPEHGFSDPARVSADDLGRTRRHSQTLIDSHRNPTAHWDGEFETIGELVLARIGALRGRGAGLGHGVSLADAVTGASGPTTADGVELGNGLEDSGEPEQTEQEDDVIDDGDDPGGGGGGGGGYDPSAGDGRREVPRRGASSAGGTPPSSTGSRGATSRGAAGPTTPTTPRARGAVGPDGADAPQAKAPGGAAPQAKAPQGKAAEPKAGQAPGAAKRDRQDADQPALSPAERRKRLDALRKAVHELPLAEDVLEQGGRYVEAFEAAFGNRRVNAQRIAKAIDAYCNSLRSGTSPFDRYMAGDMDALSPAAKRGMRLFRGRAACARCHTMEGDHPPFTDFDFHNTGVVYDGLSPTQRAALADHDATFRGHLDMFQLARATDEGRARISTRRDDLRAFKTPTLRDVARRGPYMHDGRFATLHDVVAYYARGASPDPVRSPHVRAFTAGPQDLDDLVAFLEALSSDVRPGLPARPSPTRAPKTRLRFVDADGKPLAGLPVRLSAVGDVAYAGAELQRVPEPRQTDAKGWIEFVQRRTTHTRIVLPEGLEPLHGALVPESCAKATVVVPVRGRTTIVARLPRRLPVPPALAAEHLGTFVLPGHDTPRTRLVRDTVLDLDDARVVRYSGWVRTDVPDRVRVRIPGLRGAERVLELRPDETVRMDFLR